MHSRLEEYVAQVSARLSALPGERREEEIAELRQHLESMTEANRELGLSEEEAVSAVIRQFGSARTVGNSLYKAAPAPAKPLPGNLLTAALCQVAGLYGGAWAGIYLLFEVHRDGLHFRFSANPSDAVIVGIIVTAAAFVCFASGAITGLVAPRKAIPGALAVYGLMLSSEIFAFRHFLFSWEAIMHHFRWWLPTLLPFGVAVSLSILGGKMGVRIRAAQRARLLNA